MTASNGPCLSALLTHIVNLNYKRSASVATTMSNSACEDSKSISTKAKAQPLRPPSPTGTQISNFRASSRGLQLCSWTLLHASRLSHRQLSTSWSKRFLSWCPLRTSQISGIFADHSASIQRYRCSPRRNVYMSMWVCLSLRYIECYIGKLHRSIDLMSGLQAQVQEVPIDKVSWSFGISILYLAISHMREVQCLQKGVCHSCIRFTD